MNRGLEARPPSPEVGSQGSAHRRCGPCAWFVSPHFPERICTSPADLPVLPSSARYWPGSFLRRSAFRWNASGGDARYRLPRRKVPRSGRCGVRSRGGDTRSDPPSLLSFDRPPRKCAGIVSALDRRRKRPLLTRLGRLGTGSGRWCPHVPAHLFSPPAPVPEPAWASTCTGKRVSELRIPGPGRGHVLPPRKGSRGVRVRFRVGSLRRNRFETLQIRLGNCVFTPRAVRSEHGRVWQRSFVRAPIGFRGRRCRGLRSELPRPQARCRCRAFHRRVRSRSPQPRSCG